MSKEFWNNRYREDGFAYGETPNDFLNENFEYFNPKGQILCIAEGEGRNARFLAEQGFVVSAVDFSEVGMNKLKQISDLKNLGVTTYVADLNGFDFGITKWDAVVSIFAHLPQEQRKNIHSKIIMSLKPGGIFLLEAYRDGQQNLDTGGPKDLDLLMSIDKLKSEIIGLELIFFKELQRYISEGKYHQGESLTVQLIAKKPLV